MDSLWDENASDDAPRDTEWTKMSSEFTNVRLFQDFPGVHSLLNGAQAGYREGITSGKESALQEGFDSGFATVGAPIGREIGRLRGIVSGVLAFLTSSSLSAAKIEGHIVEAAVEARDIASKLAELRFSDIAPRDLEAEEHARQHLESSEDSMEIENEELVQKRDMERLEDMISQLNPSADAGVAVRMTMNDVRTLKHRLKSLCDTLGFGFDWI